MGREGGGGPSEDHRDAEGRDSQADHLSRRGGRIEIGEYLLAGGQ